MQIVFDSMTGNVRRFAAGVQLLLDGLPVHDLRRDVPAGEYLLMTYTFGTGGVPETTARFLAQQAGGLRGVVSSGSFHWGTNFARAGEQIAAQYGVPLVAKINKAGNAADRELVASWLRTQMGTLHGSRTAARPTHTARSLYGTLD
ncbi:class Ib ribonucleoside-diphosphate reductase assembly flavoprotein NrdI (plasmid) [Deinococcus sp. KNUC1210]|uniref:ribonucleotide reductase stimulatory protein n=1 Tax=Deinococcus sp. KNUC1210 TaxID=2917691 RepID=UPI001EF117DB|nr:class Ib ribonucleoside-diphosphate reductase assembly flavoprotein NrdI [Deinococcus sp. KNUC1210]ULH17470.1 class Ib ribonucleoside-diphosphate reductase assembly flavoprotein NrdI [Deinococcus sp. KNUC1210]